MRLVQPPQLAETSEETAPLVPFTFDPAARPSTAFPQTQSGIRIGELVGRFLRFKQQQVASAELSPRTFDGYRMACDEMLAHLGPARPVAWLRPDDFGRLRAGLSERFGARGLATYIRMVKTCLRWAYEAELIDRPLRFGGMFSPPTRAVIRRSTQRTGMFEARDIRRLLDVADGAMRAFILLGINCGYGQTDCADLRADAARQAAADGWLSIPRAKTGIDRQAWLWPETRQALREHARPDGLAFLTCRGNPWVRSIVHHDEAGQIASVTPIDQIGAAFRKLARGVSGGGIKPARFYCLRRTFLTVADGLADPHATARVMGHLVPGMAGVYLQRIEPDRIRAVCEHVRDWLYRR